MSEQYMHEGLAAETQRLVLERAAIELYGGQLSARHSPCRASIYSARFGLEAQWGHHTSTPADLCKERAKPCWRVCAGRPLARGETAECCELLDLGALSGLSEDGSSSLHQACFWQRRRDKPANPVLPMGFGALYRRARDNKPASLAASWGKGGCQLVLVADRDVEKGEELTLPHDVAAALRQQAVGGTDADTPEPEDGNSHGEATEEDWDAIEAQLQELEEEDDDDEPPADEACASSQLTEEFYRQRARVYWADQESQAKSPVWALEPAGPAWLPSVEAGITAGAVRAGRSRVHGLGVFALADLAPQTLVEACPALLLDDEGRAALADYAMGVEASQVPGRPVAVSTDGLPTRFSVLAVGCGALYNHREPPNAAWCYIGDVAGGMIALVALRQVSAGEELFISYGMGYWQGRSAPELVAACARSLARAL